MGNFARAWWLFFALLAVGLGMFYFVAASQRFPAMSIDAAAHLVPILNYKAGHGFGSVVWSMTRDYDPTGQHRFLQYPPLFHLAVAGLIRHSAVVEVYECLAAFVMAALGLYAVLIGQRAVAGAARGQPRWIALACLSLVAISTWLYQLPSSGRPETLATPVVVLAVIALLRAPRRWQPVVAGGFIGVLGAMQTAVAVLAGLLYAVYVSTQATDGAIPVHGVDPASRREAGASKTSAFPGQSLGTREGGNAAANPRIGIRTGLLARWLKAVATAAAISLGVFTVCLSLSPHPLSETLRGMTFHLAQLPAGDFSVFAYYLLPAVSGTCYGLLYAVLLIHYLWWRGRAWSWLGRVNLGMFLAVVWALAVHHPNRCYNLLPFAPVFLALALRLVAQLEAPETASAREITPARRTGIYAVYFAVFALMSIGFTRQVAVYAVYARHGVSYAEAARAFRTQFPAGVQTPVLFDSGLFTLLDRFDHAYQRMRDSFSPLDAVPGPVKPTLLVHQWYGRLTAPPTVPGYRLVWNDFVDRPPPRFLGLKISSATPGYAFAVYQPVSP